MHRISKRIAAVSITLLILALSACSNGNESSSERVANEIILATTTSTQDSGLLDYLLPEFHELSEFEVKTIAVGTGKALKMAEDGNADVLFVHAPPAEVELVENGFGIDRTLIMHNDFVIVGPADDPAGILTTETAAEAFQEIINSGSIFVSRGDDSGTHKKELEFWNFIERQPEGESYLESGQGMAATLRIASEKLGYTLTDRATYLANRDNIDLEILVAGDERLLNIYHVISVNPEKWPLVNYEGAQAFTAFLTSDNTQQLIGEFGIDQFGQPLFFPDAGKSAADFGLE
jgi:tungstate transport system substrate-binding protein